jgi:GT2 family glycosyltransferase
VLPAQATVSADAAVDGTIWVLLPIHDRRQVTERFVESLAAQIDRNYRLILIDDGSTDGSADAVCSVLPETTVIRGRGNWWWGGGLQQGRLWLLRHKWGRGDLVLLANANTVFEPDFLAEGRLALAHHPRALLQAQLYRLSDGSFVEAGVHVDWRALRFTGVADTSAINCLSTRGLLMRADDFIAIGGFHPRLLPHYGSDYEFTIRAKRRGYALISDPSFKLSYDEETSGRRPAEVGSVRLFLKTSFSKRTIENPAYWTTFILLSCPPRLVPRNLLRVWKTFARQLVQARRSRA